jgi:hypothetical protein
MKRNTIEYKLLKNIVMYLEPSIDDQRRIDIFLCSLKFSFGRRHKPSNSHKNLETSQLTNRGKINEFIWKIQLQIGHGFIRQVKNVRNQKQKTNRLPSDTSVTPRDFFYSRDQLVNEICELT